MSGIDRGRGARILICFWKSRETLQYCIYSSVYTVLYNRTVSDIVIEKIKNSRAPQRKEFIMSGIDRGRGAQIFNLFWKSRETLQYCIYSSVYTVLYNRTVSEIVPEKN